MLSRWCPLICFGVVFTSIDAQSFWKCPLKCPKVVPTKWCPLICVNNHCNKLYKKNEKIVGTTLVGTTL